MRDFQPLSCNANLASAACSTWSSVFGTGTSYATRITIPCGQCITMDHVGDLELLGGLDVIGKLVFPDGYSLNLASTMISVMAGKDEEWATVVSAKSTLPLPSRLVQSPFEPGEDKVCFIGPSPDRLFLVTKQCASSLWEVPSDPSVLNTDGVPSTTGPLEIPVSKCPMRNTRRRRRHRRVSRCRRSHFPTNSEESGTAWARLPPRVYSDVLVPRNDPTAGRPEARVAAVAWKGAEAVLSPCDIDSYKRRSGPGARVSRRG
jgi:hypothetical protein